MAETTEQSPRIFDSHAHVLTAGPNSKPGAFELVGYAHNDAANSSVADLQAADYEFRTSLMKKVGITTSILMCSNVYERPDGIRDTRRQNDYVAWYRDQHPDTFPIAIGTIEPNQGVDVGLAELHRMKEELHIDGVCWHHQFSGSSIDEHRMVAFARELATLGMPAYIHLNVQGLLESVTHLGRLAEASPETVFVGLGAFSSFRNMHDLRDVCERCPNISLETSLAWAMGQPILEFAERFGSERLMFGTDMHFDQAHIWIYPTGLIDILQSERLSESDRENILWANAERLYPALAKLH